MRIFGFGDAIVAAALVAAVATNPPAYVEGLFATLANPVGCIRTGTCVSKPSAVPNGRSGLTDQIRDNSTDRGRDRNSRDGSGRRGIFRKCGRRLRVIGLR
jgi:hypothetical protein